jgi:hypothetical protein
MEGPALRGVWLTRAGGAGAAYALEDSDSKQAPEVFAGLKNEGASCYLNSLLQCLCAAACPACVLRADRRPRAGS